MSMKIKKGKLNYDQSGRAYPNNPRVKENWDCIWEYEGKYYKLVGDNEHKEWDEVNIYNQIIDDAYDNYKKEMLYHPEENWLDNEVGGKSYRQLSQEEFINKCKTYPEFSERWGLKIEERELSTQERNEWFQIHLNGNNPFMKSDWKDFELDQQNIPTRLITLTYKDTIIESYE